MPLDTRFESEQEREFEKLWDRPIYFDSFSSYQRGLMVLLKDSLPAKNVKMENILLGDYSRLTLSLGDTKVLIKCCYAPNDDMSALDSESENYSNRFLKMVFDDRNDIDYDVTMMVGDFNVAPDPDKDTQGNLHVNNPNT